MSRNYLQDMLLWFWQQKAAPASKELRFLNIYILCDNFGSGVAAVVGVAVVIVRLIQRERGNTYGSTTFHASAPKKKT